MSEKEVKILNDTKAQYPFNVPDGYFDNLAARIMEQIPEETTSANVVQMYTSNRHTNKSQNIWIKILSVAACTIFIVLASVKFLPFNDKNSEDFSAKIPKDSDIESLYGENETMYSMLENGDIYNYLAGNEE